MGKAFKKEAKSISDLLANLSLEDIATFESKLESQGEFQLNDSVKITKDMVQVKRQTKQVIIFNYTFLLNDLYLAIDTVFHLIRIIQNGTQTSSNHIFEEWLLVNMDCKHCVQMVYS